MASFKERTVLPFPRQVVFDYHNRIGALPRLVPPWQKVEIEQPPTSFGNGSRVIVSVAIGPFRKRWVAEHFDCVEGEQFCDRQIEGPFKSFTHTHRFLPGPDESQSVLEDQINYQLPAGALGTLLLGRKIRRDIERGFAFRHARTRFDLFRHAKYAALPELRIAITGASGSIGSNLVPFLTTAGHDVISLLRRAPNAPNEVQWNPQSGEMDLKAIGKVDVVVHLAGKNIATRWTESAKREIYDSRVVATRKICEQLARMDMKPRVLVCASAIGCYGDRGEERLTEESPPGEGWLEKTCVDWEAATQPARDAGIRVVNLRTAIVLSARHGALARMLTPAKLGIAGRVGSGRQWMPWISMDDQIGVIYEAIRRDDWSGPINAVTDSVRQVDFIRTLGKVLRRPTFLSMPAAAVGLLFGRMGRELLLGSVNAQPAKLRSSGFEWMLPNLEEALRSSRPRTSARLGLFDFVKPVVREFGQLFGVAHFLVGERGDADGKRRRQWQLPWPHQMLHQARQSRRQLLAHHPRTPRHRDQKLVSAQPISAVVLANAGEDDLCDALE